MSRSCRCPNRRSPNPKPKVSLKRRSKSRHRRTCRQRKSLSVCSSSVTKTPAPGNHWMAAAIRTRRHHRPRTVNRNRLPCQPMRRADLNRRPTLQSRQSLPASTRSRKLTNRRREPLTPTNRNRLLQRLWLMTAVRSSFLRRLRRLRPDPTLHRNPARRRPRSRHAQRPQGQAPRPTHWRMRGFRVFASFFQKALPAIPSQRTQWPTSHGGNA